MSLLALTERLMPHLLLAPILLPMLTAALMLTLSEQHQRIKLLMNITSCTLGLAIAIALVKWSNQEGVANTMSVYLAGNWAAPFGIVLVLDRLSALMLLTTSVVATCAVIYSGARWHRAGVHFHVLFQFQLMGLAGAFLTGDLFNLFVFFEIMLAASYGLLLHGSGKARVQHGLHYIAINLAASSLFLIGVSMLYGITGTLNMADLARIIPSVSGADRGLLHTAAGILATAFLIKAAVWPLNFWLVPAYGAATAPVGAIFALMTKVGIYTILRLWTLMFSTEAGPSAYFGSAWLILGGLATMGYAGVAMLGTQRLGYVAGYAAILSAGTLLAATGFGQNLMTAALLYYLPSSTLAVAVLFLLADLIDRWRTEGSDVVRFDDEEAPFLTPELLPREGLNLDEDEEVLIGRVIPASMAFLGLSFVVCTLVISGLPPLSGFVGKFAMLDALLNPLGLGSSAGNKIGWLGGLFMAALIGTGLMALTALVRIGIREFWSSISRKPPKLKVIEGLPIGLLLGCTVLMVVYAGDVMRYTQRAANNLHSPGNYMRSVLDKDPLPSPSAAPSHLLAEPDALPGAMPVPDAPTSGGSAP
ncbi:monovalent cation/H+ antiporter subunit D [Comamonas odontotermitis]|uniref:monovalent cation/H+ antiporter subunit D n=1 Tax=Comamonas odontotermitis TaxID=379895 RepID=UPI001CC670DB|nr:monovalent cation/H+ antiporter subunit D [Comamonas odontotermitis]UBB18663.1 monovalent cation/H+ antiporter subunit D [Comamonas odontotermitis]